MPPAALAAAGAVLQSPGSLAIPAMDLLLACAGALYYYEVRVGTFRGPALFAVGFMSENSLGTVQVGPCGAMRAPFPAILCPLPHRFFGHKTIPLVSRPHCCCRLYWHTTFQPDLFRR